MKSKFSNYLCIRSGPTPGVSPASGQSNVQLQPQQPSGGQQLQQAALSPPVPTRRSRVWGKLKRTPSPSPSPSPSLSPTANNAPCPSTSAPPLGPNPSPHSSQVWEKALEIADKKLRENGLPQLDRTSLPSQSAEENIGAVVKGLNTLQEVCRENQWSYTWHGKKIIVMDRLGKILTIVGGYSVVVGTAVQTDHVGALVWAGVHGIMRVCISFLYHGWSETVFILTSRI